MTGSWTLYARKAAAAGILAVLFGALWLVIGAPYVNALTQSRTDAQLLRTQIDHLQALIQSQDTIAAELDRAHRNNRTKSFVFSAQTQALAAAQMQKTVKGIITANGGLFSSAQTVPHDLQDAPFPAIKLRVTYAATSANIGIILQRLDATTPFVFTDGLEIRATPDGRLNVRQEFSAFMGRAAQ